MINDTFMALAPKLHVQVRHAQAILTGDGSPEKKMCELVPVLFDRDMIKLMDEIERELKKTDKP